MTGFTQRTVHRALGASGRIQPRIAPITAPDPWVTPDAAELGLEVYEELEARREPGVRGVQARRGSAETQPEPEPRLEPEGVGARGVSLEEPSTADAAVVPAPEQPAAPRRGAPPLPSFRASALEVESALVPAVRPMTPRAEPLEGLEAAVTVETPGPPREPNAAARVDAAPAVRELAEPAVRRFAARPGLATEGLAEAQAPSMRAAEPREGFAPPIAFDEQAWASPVPSLEPGPTRRSRRAGAEASGPVVRIEIGKVELRAPSPLAPEPASAAISKPAEFVSLTQYLHERGTS
jgi:hypothetical protein